MVTFDQFISQWNGRYLDFDGKFGYQCMDLFRKYLVDVCGLPAYNPFPGVSYAKNLWNYSPLQFEKIKNTPTGIPSKGDIVIWGTYVFVTGIAGHVGIFTEGDVNKFISFDQNYAPTGSPCKLNKHSYKGVLGWFRLNPK